VVVNQPSSMIPNLPKTHRKIQASLCWGSAG